MLLERAAGAATTTHCCCDKYLGLQLLVRLLLHPLLLLQVLVRFLTPTAAVTTAVAATFTTGAVAGQRPGIATLAQR